MVSFKVKKKEITEILKMMSSALTKGKQKASVAVEITVKDGRIELVVPGAKFFNNCSTSGSCKVSILFDYLQNIVNTSKEEEIEFLIEENLIKTGSLEIGAKTTFFEDDRVLRSIALPINYKITNILRLPQMGYTPEEIAFNNLTGKLNEAKEELEKKIEKAAGLLKIYGVTVDELRELTHKKLYKDKN
jgi:hypothetical protein